MKKTFILMAVMAVAALAACNKQPVGSAYDGGEIVLGVSDDFGFIAETRATAVTSVPSTLYWGATTGTSSETSKWSAVSASVSSGTIHTGKYQTASPTTYNYYVANATFTVGETTSMTVANNNTDIVVGRVASSSVNPSVTLGHIFARTGTLSLTATNGYEITGTPTWTIKSASSGTHGTSGTYNMKNGSWSSASGLTSAATLTSSSDMYLVPGTYEVTVNYNIKNGDWTGTGTGTATVTLDQGKINNIVGTVTGTGATEIQITVTVDPWTTTDKNVTF